MIKLTKDDYERIVEYARAQLPNEACGLIAGEKVGGDKLIK